MIEHPPDEEIEVGRDDVILLRYGRSWPKATVEWTRRRRNLGSQSFPVASGVVKLEGPGEPDWQAIRTEALDQANAADTGAADAAKPRSSFWGRLRGR